jgi:hypothetical protein
MRTELNVNLLLIYISEAHAIDVWPIGESAGTINYKHKTLDDRIKCANKFIDEFNFKIPTVVDDMNDTFEKTMASWPFRFYILLNNQIKFIGYPKDGEFDLTEIYDFFRK